LDRLFDVVLVRPPSNSYEHCVSSNSDRESIDIQLAKAQHHSYVSVLKENDITVLELLPCDEYPDSVFMQDPALLGLGRSIIGRFGEISRRGEELNLVSELNQLQMVKNSPLLRVSSPATLEGGDIMVTDQQQLFVGQSSRTNSSGILQLQAFLPDTQVTTVKTDSLHLLCGCSYLNESTMIITPELVSPQNFPNLKHITFAVEDAYASDALYLGNRRVLLPSGFPNASKKLRQGGYTPVEVDVSEFRKGDGGVTCLSSPIYKTI